MVSGIINCGACGFVINIEAEVFKKRMVKLRINSDCPHYQKVSDELGEVNAFEELFPRQHQGTVCRVMSQYIPHPSCPGLTGILKIVEVAAGLALPQTVTIVIKDGQI